MAFDSTCKFLAESFPSDFATWLLGKPIVFSKLSPSELSLEPIRADALILFDSDDLILHIEFQTEPDPDMPFRLADYRLRIFRRFPGKQVRQIVIYLNPTTSELVYQTAFAIPGTRHEFEVIRLWEQPTDIFFEALGLLPLAVLSNTQDKNDILRQVASRIDAIPELRTQANLAASASLLAGLVLKKDFIHQVLRREIMQQSVIYQEWREEFLQEGKLEGKREGKLEGKLEEAFSLVCRQLSRRIGNISPELSAQVQALPLTQIEALGEALLDFSSPNDLTSWLHNNQG
ncbi:Rpn family recombination-promoting nuclease/putative transposase [Altericista sp. CCNU0014]|uniref:Rpn family recombination-promoting nuclease/putative transposase n=1 Tax=Altericista sp. CCNU0014 TaxID=3082949 RepID=UPI00384AF6D6